MNSSHHSFRCIIVSGRPHNGDSGRLFYDSCGGGGGGGGGSPAVVRKLVEVADQRERSMTIGNPGFHPFDDSRRPL